MNYKKFTNDGWGKWKGEINKKESVRKKTIMKQITKQMNVYSNMHTFSKHNIKQWEYIQLNSLNNSIQIH